MRTFDPDAKASKYFTWKEILWLHSWNRMANESDGLNDTVLDAAVDFLTKRMDPIHEYLTDQFPGRAIRINCHDGFRPHEYNAFVRGATNSSHMYRRDPELKDALIAALDWDADVGEGSAGANCDKIRLVLLPKLEDFGVRMEDRGKAAPWIHNDNHPVMPGGNRYFKP